MSESYDRQMMEVIELMTITQTELTALRMIEFMPAGERRLLLNIRKLIRLIRGKLLALPMPPNSSSQMLSMEIMFTMKDHQDGKLNRAAAVNKLLAAGVEINAVVYLLDLIRPATDDDPDKVYQDAYNRNVLAERK